LNNKYEQIANRLDLDKLTKNMLLEVTALADKRMTYFYPPDKFEEKIFFTIFLFLAKPQKKEIEEEKIELLKYLITNTSDKCEASEKFYSSGRFSYLIVNLVHFFSFMLVYFLLSVTFLQLYENFSKSQIEKLIGNKQKVGNIEPDKLREYFHKKLALINKNINPENILSCVLPYIFDPIKESNIYIKLIFSCQQ
jgi:hypothetical protein